MGDSSEEKKYAATPKKLSDARKKGQLPHSSDFVRAVGTCAGLGYLWLRGSAIEDKCREALLIIERLLDLPFDIATRQALVMLFEITLSTVGPLLGALVTAVILANLLASGGFVFSLEPMKPNLEKIGLKRLASAHAMVELGKTLFKGFVLSATFSLCLLGMWKTMVYMPVCGTGCLGFVVAGAKRLIGIGAGALLVSGLIDLLLQRALFLREMRMTQTEVTREVKDQRGAPELKQERRRIRDEAADELPLGVHRATLVFKGRAILIGLRYVPGETGVPVVVCRAHGERVSNLLSEARALGLEIVDNHVLAHKLLSNAKLGNPIPGQYFAPVAGALFAAGLA
ncbi:EscU/YscU/HrcU family type III secretion system export apparatus switch protein [Sinorhizobium meliloti]|uniref:EscU/YscU/HrcU family type III secretion system export apparatus switch protein n=1 Tax=Rhizobium meliloti TaxID=382 RepID=UPI00207389CD|nr:EscU/YscU/HrcU family type III secretion system export apparatus switch protein [Sinorhizobium meliloti]MCM5688419.1 EscU/YscU/HrcU family type III secretion system export apparatus switch protein [Sinorhizobium meliloti]